MQVFDLFFFFLFFIFSPLLSRESCVYSVLLPLLHHTLCVWVQIEKLSAVEQTPKTAERDVLKELFPYEVFNTPTGIR